MKHARAIRRALAAALAALLLLPAGCGREQPTVDGPVTLRVLTNAMRSERYGMHYELNRLIKKYQAEHENVTIELEFLPEPGEERETRLEQLRTEIMAGGGPDLYVMTPYIEVQLAAHVYNTVLDGGLFPDVEQAMYNGLFYDVSALYDGDDGLNTEELTAGVMDAGVVDGARYMLPLRYNYPVVYADRARLERSGMDVEAMKSSVTGLFRELLEHGDTPWFNGGAAVVMRGDPFYLFPRVIDYKTETVQVTAGELVEFTRQCWEIEERCNAICNGMPSVSMYMVQVGSFPLALPELKDGGEDPYALRRAPLVVNSFSNAVHTAALARLEGVELEMFPLRCVDGSLSAEITWWGAVGAGSGHPETAYDFLRLLLLPESQWDLKRPVRDDAVPGLMASGWPVRAIGSVEPLWSELTAQLERFRDEGRTKAVLVQTFQDMPMTDGDILPLLTAEIDGARVPITVGSEWRMVLNLRDEYRETVDAEAQETIDALRRHVAEG